LTGAGSATSGARPRDLLNLRIEAIGEQEKDKAAKVATARTLWVPAINSHGGFGRWNFVEISDPWDAENMVRAHLNGKQEDHMLLLLRL
jgi:type III restriction enzyme